jgi:hypothetical protein
MALFIRLLLGIPMFAMLCAISALGISLAVQSSTVGLRLQGMELAVFFAVLAFAIWRILLFRRAESSHSRLALGGGSSGGGSSGSPGPPDAGKPSPLSPSETHHLAAAKDVPPLDKSHSLPHD